MTEAARKAERIGAWCDRVALWAAFFVPTGIVLGNAAFESLVALAALAWLVRAAVLGRNPVPALIRRPLVLAWLVWYAAILASLLANGPGSKGLGHDVAFVRFYLFVAALVDVGRRRPVGRFLSLGLAVGVGAGAVNALMAWTVGFDMIGRPLWRYTDKLKEASRISGLCAYAFGFFMAWGLSDARLTRRQRAGALAVALIALVHVFQTQVRTSIVAAIGGMLFAVAFGARKRVSTVTAVLVAVLVVTAGVGLFSARDYWDLRTLYERVCIWKVSWAMVEQNPVFGQGVSSFQDAYREIAADPAAATFVTPDGVTIVRTFETHAHNVPLMLLASTGILGLAAFAWLFVAACRQVFADTGGWRAGLVAWPVVLVILGAMGFNIYHGWYQALQGFFIVMIAAPRRTAFGGPGTHAP